jgi:hypothetical protein
MKLQKAINYGQYGEFFIRELINGDLQVSISEENRLELAAYSEENEYEFPNLYEYFEDSLEYLAGNSDFEFMDGQYQSVLACWGGPVITKNMPDPDCDDFSEVKVWAYEQYALRLEIEDLIEFGEVIYKAVEFEANHE